MPLPTPQMAKRDTLLVRHIKNFHEKFVDRVTSGSKETLRSTAWQIDAMIEENKKYRDSEYLRTILATIEWIIQKKWGTKWTVARAKSDLRGRTRGVNQHAPERDPITNKLPVPASLQKALEAKLMLREARESRRG